MNHVLVIAEKPKAAEKIASALGTPKKKKLYNVPYWEVVNGTKIIVASAAGHLYGIAAKSNSFPIYSYEWKPLYEIDKSSSHTKKFLLVLGKVAKGASLYVNACDYDIEGSVIGFMVIKNLGDLRKARRMVFHALTPQELRRAWRNLRPLDWEMVEAGLTRHELDWLWGINVSRALMRAYREATGRSKSLSAGRVQSPTLLEAVKRELQIGTFVPLPYFSITISSKGVTFEPSIKFEKKSETLSWKSKCNRGVVRDVVSRVERLRPPHPFNLPDLQQEAARLFGFSPAKTQKIAEDLYLDAYISYPRTNSQKYPKDLDLRGILDALKKSQYSKYVYALIKETKGVLQPNNGPKDDPAHPAIYPTGKVPSGLDKEHAMIYDLIVRRFMATMATEAKYEVVTVELEVNGVTVKATGRRTLWKGWSLYYPFSAPQEKELPDFSKGEVVEVSCSLRQQLTKAPERYTKASLVKWMEKVGIGTEATRARIVETLFKRGYLRDLKGKVYATDLGIAVASVLLNFFPELTSVELTRKFEIEMENVRLGKRKREEVVEEAKSELKRLISKYLPRLGEVGLSLAYSLGDLEPSNPCPICGRPRVGQFCEVHEIALSNLKSVYPVWKERMGLSWREYLEKASKGKSFGTYVREVATYVLGNTPKTSP
ncbi:DNA topoisomerase I [Ignicoccus islandicus DSM 13165]|uniref:DNA topoisomerase n=1 Tax=Ignicoccus islandicus DSM 13165 TaxID=940295 RepID=A0A0U3FR50_9CREN|nr:DNA topoisomerase I [Ignicoccus islandicus]ALU11952.1 DNA topoisomerase I [Ignicoccus islandicus DSM 13165]